MIILITWTVVLVAACWLYHRQLFSKFNKNGIKHYKPLPIIGNMGRVLLKKQHFADNILEMYQSFPEERFVGRFEFTSENILIRDIELVKRITVKDFDHFIDHRSMFTDSESFFARNLITLKGQEWKDMRSTLSPAFTSSKIRLMVPFMVEVGDQMISALNKRIADSGVGYIDLECKDLTTRYTNDVIASCAFGLKVDSHAESDNQFYSVGKAITKFDFRQSLIIFLMVNAPILLSY